MDDALKFFREMGNVDNGHTVDLGRIASISAALRGSEGARAAFASSLLLALERIRLSPEFIAMVQQSAGFTVWHEGLWFQQVVAGARAVAVLTRGRLPLEEADLVRLADHALARPEIPKTRALMQLEGFVKRASLTDALRARVQAIHAESLRSTRFAAITKRCDALLAATPLPREAGSLTSGVQKKTSKKGRVS